MSETHKNSLLSVSGRKAMVDSVLIAGVTKVEASKKYNVTPQTVKKWVVRYKEEGESGLEDHSSRPDSIPSSTPVAKVAEIITLRKEEKLTGDHISRKLKIPLKTVSRILVQANLSRQKDIEPQEDQPMRYEHEALGDMVFLHKETPELQRERDPERRYWKLIIIKEQGSWFPVYARGC